MRADIAASANGRCLQVSECPSLTFRCLEGERRRKSLRGEEAFL